MHPPAWPELVQLICDAPAMWEPGTAAGYHGTSAHVILGELVRVIDGRPVAQYVADEVFGPLGITDSCVAIPLDELDALRPRLAEIRDLLPKTGPDVLPGPDFEHYNTDEYVCAISPGNTCRGPARDLGRVYEALLGGGAIGTSSSSSGRVLQPTTVEAMIACHRRGLVDQTFAGSGARPHPKWGYEYPWVSESRSTATATWGRTDRAACSAAPAPSAPSASPTPRTASCP